MKWNHILKMSALKQIKSTIGAYETCVFRHIKTRQYQALPYTFIKLKPNDFLVVIEENPQLFLSNGKEISGFNEIICLHENKLVSISSYWVSDLNI